MKKLAIASAVSLALLGAGSAVPASASDLGDLDVPVVGSDDYNGHKDANGNEVCHNNNLASVDYYNPSSDRNVIGTGGTAGNSWYIVEPDTTPNGTGGGGDGTCGDDEAPILIATGYANVGNNGFHNPSCPSASTPPRNPCDGSSAFYVATPVAGDPVNNSGGRIDAGQKGNLP